MTCISVLLSAAVVAAGPWLGEIAHGAAVLAGFALIALASMLVGLLEALGRGAWALAAVAAGVAGETAVRLADAAPFAGAGLVLGGGVVTLLVLPFVVTLLRRPATTLATALWIP
jgi:hypothetical protein